MQPFIFVAIDPISAAPTYIPRNCTSVEEHMAAAGGASLSRIRQTFRSHWSGSNVSYIPCARRWHMSTDGSNRTKSIAGSCVHHTPCLRQAVRTPIRGTWVSPAIPPSPAQKAPDTAITGNTPSCRLELLLVNAVSGVHGVAWRHWLLPPRIHTPLRRHTNDST